MDHDPEDEDREPVEFEHSLTPPKRTERRWRTAQRKAETSISGQVEFLRKCDDPI